MSPDRLIRMASQIAIFFKTQPNDDASERVAAHVRDYWEPRMRAQLRDHVASGGQGLDDVLISATLRI